MSNIDTFMGSSQKIVTIRKDNLSNSRIPEGPGIKLYNNFEARNQESLETFGNRNNGETLSQKLNSGPNTNYKMFDENKTESSFVPPDLPARPNPNQLRTDHSGSNSVQRRKKSNTSMPLRNRSGSRTSKKE